MNKRLLAASAVVCLLGGLMALERVHFHSTREFTRVGPTSSLPAEGGPVVLVRAPLTAGQQVVFEVCAGDAFAPERWRDAARFEVREQSAGELVVASAMDATRLATVRRDANAGCVTIASAGALGVSGEYAIVGHATKPDGALTAIPLVGRIVATAPMSVSDLAPLVLLFFGALGLVAYSASGRPSAPAPSPAVGPGRAALLGRAALAFSLVAFVLFAVGALPVPPPYAALLGASIIGAAQLAACLALAPRDARPGNLGFGLEPGRPRWLAAAAPFLGVSLVIIGRHVGQLVPSTEVSPIETFVGFGSGYLTVAASGLLLPIFEELFFRGLLYGLIERAAGPLAAFVVVVLAFPLMHLPQVYGAWGALASLFVTGFALTALRAASGSVAPSMLAHVVHNGLITLLGFPL